MNMYPKVLSFILFLSAASNSNLLCSTRSIDIENDSSYPINISANTVDLRIDHQVPVHSHSKIIARITSINNVEQILFNAIANNSVAQIINAIRIGANLNIEICGKKPLAWALLFEHKEAIQCLVMYGATL